MNAKSILAGGIIGLAFLITLGYFSSDIELEYSEPTEVEPAAEVESAAEVEPAAEVEQPDFFSDDITEDELLENFEAGADFARMNQYYSELPEFESASGLIIEIDRFIQLNCNPEIDKDGDNVPDNLDVEGPIDWSHCDLSGVDLSHRDMSGANLEGTQLLYAKLSGADFSGADISHSDIRYSYLYDVDFSGADLSHSSIYKALIGGDTTFDYANLSYANLCAANLDFYVLRGTDLSHAEFDHAKRLAQI